MIDIEAIKARAEAAPEGPWSVRHEHYEAGPGPDDEEQDWYLIDDCYAVEHWANYDKETTEFIAHARTDIPALIAEVERLRDIVDRVRELHRAVDVEPSETICHECSMQLPNGTYFGKLADYPCDTIRALEGP